MTDIPIIVRKNKLTYVLYQEKVLVGTTLDQWVSYNQYDNWNRQGITQFRHAILKSKDDQYDTPAEQMSLANECGIRATSTKKPVGLKL